MMRFAIAALVASMAFSACKKNEDKGQAKAAATAKEPAADKPADKPTETPPADDKPAADPALLERGEYLVGLMGCENCHTPFKGPGQPDPSKHLAGGLEIPEKFGTWRSLNITQDEETGLGKWTDEQIIAAIREGKRPNGEQLFPIMPYLFYNALSDDDAKALVAFMRTIPAVSNKVERKTDLQMPQIPAPPPSGAQPDASDPVAQGAYLSSIMHCALCHTPMTEKGPDMSRAFAGGMEFEIPMMGEGILYSPNLTPDEKTGLGNWSDEEIVAAIKQMKKRDGSTIVGPMAMYQRGWFNLTDDDTAALVAFLKSLKPIENEIPKSTFVPNGPPPAGN